MDSSDTRMTRSKSAHNKRVRDDDLPSPSKRRVPSSSTSPKKTYEAPSTPTKIRTRSRSSFELNIPLRTSAKRITKVLEGKENVRMQEAASLVSEAEDADEDDSDSDAEEDEKVAARLFIPASSNEAEDVGPPSPEIADEMEDVFSTVSRQTSVEAEGIPVASTSGSSNPATPRRPTTIFAHAAMLLSTSASARTAPLFGRTSERATLTSFLSARYPGVYDTPEPSTPRKPRPSLYISGPPGIGKTALLNSVLVDMRGKAVARDLDVRVVMDNCSSMGATGNSGSFWSRLVEGFDLEDEVPSKLKGRDAFEWLLQHADGPFLLVLDEIDYLLPSTPSRRSPTKQAAQDLLNTIFAFAHAPESRLTLIGIANALDLTAKSLRLDIFSQSSPSSRPASPSPSKGKGRAETPVTPVSISAPQILNFRPYTSEALEAIVKSRLSRLASTYPLEVEDTDTERAPLEILPLVDPKALELCAKRVAKGTGDVRAMLGTVRRAINLVEQAELIKLRPADPPSPTKPSSSRVFTDRSETLSHLTPETAPKVNMKTMLEALRAGGLGTPPALATQVSQLNFDHRLALVGIVVALQLGALASVRETVAFTTFTTAVEKERTVKAKNAHAFRDALDALECGGFLKGQNATGASSARGKKTTAVGGGRVIALGGTYTTQELVEGLRTTPSVEIGGAVEELLRISKNIIDKEEDRLARIKKQQQKVVSDVPMEGFHGDGLREGVKYIGERRRKE